MYSANFGFASSARTALLSAMLSLLLNPARAQHTNVIIGSYNSPNETTIYINPSNPQQMVAAANIDNVYYSDDGGKNWKQTLVSCPWGIWGDPVMVADTAGTFYYFHLSYPPSNGSWLDRIVCQKSQDGGVTWSPGSYMGLNGMKAQDKPWVAIDRKTNNIYVTWTQFDIYGSSEPTDSSNIMFAKSNDGGNSWSPALRINREAGDCLDNDNTVEGAVPAIGPNGEIYVCWAYRDSLWFDRSVDTGRTWLDQDIFVASQFGGWAHNISGISRANGLPVTACDLSDGPYRGTIYVSFVDQRNGLNNPDIWLVKSLDNGNTWTDPVRVNDDNTETEQFFSWMTLDPVTGWLWFVFYDRRRYTDTRTDVYMAVF